MTQLRRRSTSSNPPPGKRRASASSLSPRQLWFFRFVLLLLPLVVLGLVEVGLRLGGYGYNPQFFRRLRLGDQEYFVQNEDFGCRFFPKELTRHPGPVRFPVHKAPGTFRIFVFGESAAMGDPAESFAPDRYLAMLLQEKYPGTRFEIINVAFTAINSHVILPIARECAAHEGDLWIVYMGNNEMVGPFGAATVFGWQAPPLSCVRLALALQRFRIGQGLMELGRKLRGHATPAAGWSGMEMFLNNQVAPDSPRKQVVYRNFARNLDDIVRAGTRSGAKVLLNTVAVNLKDCPPFASMNSPALSPADRARFDEAYTKALHAATRKEFAEATELFAQAGQLDGDSAELQFHWGEALLAQTNVAGAREHFQLACDHDALCFRADSRINAAIRAEQKRNGGERLILLDAASALATGSPDGICGQETFYEHVHFDFDGRYRLGVAWAREIEPLLPPNTNAWLAQEVCQQKLGLSAWNRAQVLHFVDERMQAPPLSSQPNNARRRGELEARINLLAKQMNSTNAATTRQAFLELLRQRPEDYFLHQEYAVFLELTGDFAGAATEWQRYRDLVPQDPLGYYEAGRMLKAQQRYAEAEAALRTAATIRPNRTDAWSELGHALAAQDKYPEALACYSTALKQDPRNPRLLLFQGKVLARVNRHREAAESYRQAIQLSPDDGLLHHELAVELVATGETEAVGKELGEAARLSPGIVIARFDYGTWLLKQNRWAEAQREFEAVLHLDPGNAGAGQNLAWLQANRWNRP